MKVLLIAALFAPYRRGGAEVVAETTARELARAGHEVTVLTTEPFSGIASLHVREDTTNSLPGIRIMRFFPLNIFSFIRINHHGVFARLLWHGFDMLNLHSYSIVKNLLRREPFDLVITHNLKGIGYTTALAIRRFFKNTWVHTIHDFGVLFPRGVLCFDREQSFENTSLLVRLYGAINRALFGSPHMVVSRSQFFLDYYASRGFFAHSQKKRLTHDVAPRALEHATRPEGVCKFIFVGQLEEYKGVLVLLDAWKLFRVHNSNAELHIVGDGSLHTAVVHAATADSSIIFHGEAFSNPVTLAQILPRMHAALVPTLAYENTALTVLEALGVGLPLIASDIGGVKEVFEINECGILVPPADSAALAHAMEAMTRVQWESYSGAALTVAAHYHASAYCEELFSLLHGSQKLKKPVL